MLSGKIKKEKDPIGFWYMVKKIYPMAFRVKPVSYLIFSRCLAMILHVFIAANVMITQVFVDAVYKASTGEGTFKGAILAFILFVSFKLANEIFEAMNYFTGNVQIEKFRGYINTEINKKSALIDPVEYENPKRLDDINKAVNGAASVVSFFYFTTGFVLRYVTFFVFMGFYLANLKPTLILALLFVFVPVLVAQIMRSSVVSKLEDKSAPIRRETDAYNDALCGKNFYKETKNLGSFKYLKNLLINTINSLSAAVWGAQKRNALIDLGFNTLSFLGYGGVLFLLVKYLLDGEISVGAFAAVYNSIGLLFGKMEEVVRYRIGEIANSFGQIRNFLRFMEMPDDKRPDLKINKKADIIIENASFRYPNAGKDSLKNINMTIKPGETIAIVGENGAGKTTLVKLITGLYKATKGTVKIGETDVDNINYKSLFENVSGVFQKYQRYAMALKENVQIADFDSQKDVEPVLEKNNVHINSRDMFPNGLDTMLSREFDGVDLSGGQWQRIAIARGFYRDSDIIVLDEPTASIDPIEESAIYKKFVEIAKDKTTVIVTHRMGSAKIAGRIIVMKDGEIAEIGSHDELVNSGGIYSVMYSAQADWYK